MSRSTSAGALLSKKCATDRTSNEKQGDADCKLENKNVTRSAPCINKDPFKKIYLPVAREEVLLALGTGDTRLWEERLIRFAGARLPEVSDRSIAAKTLIEQLHLSFGGQLDELLNDKDKGSAWPDFPWTTATDGGNKEPVTFLSFSGNRFFLLMELLQYAVRFDNMHASSGPSEYSAYLLWDDELLQILSNLLTFHGNMPLVGYFVSVLLNSYINALVECRNTAAASLGQDTYADPYDELDERINTGGAFAAQMESQNETDMHNLLSHKQWKTHSARLCDPIFASLISRLTQLYYPLWRTMRDEARPDSSASLRHSLTVYAHCVPMPLIPNADSDAEHLRALAVPVSDDQKTQKESHSGFWSLWTNNQRKSIKGNEKRENLTRFSSNRGNFVPSVFSSQTPLNIEAELELRKRDVDGPEASRGKSHTVKKSDVPLSNDFLDEIVVCVTLANTGRVALLHDLLGPGPLPRELQNVERSNGETFEFMRRVRRSGGYSTVGIINSGAKIILSVEKEWRKQADSVSKDGSLTDQSADSFGFVEKHRWLALAAKGAVEIISQSCCLPMGYSQVPPQEDQCLQQSGWVYGLLDYYYINLFLVSCSVAGYYLPASLLPFTVQLTHFALSDAVLSGESNLDPKATGVEEDEKHTLAVGTLCMTACRFLRLGYQLGSVVSNNEHVRWISTVLQRHVKLWFYYLRRVILLMNVQVSTTFGGGVDAHSAASVNDVSNTAVWRTLWWRTTAILESIFVLRDLFRFAFTWSVVNDTSVFRSVLVELGEVFCVVCWIDMRKKGPAVALPVLNPDVALSPFPVMADLAQRFYLGSMLAFVLCAMSDTLLAFHSWMNIREAFFSDDDDADCSADENDSQGNIEESSEVSRMDSDQQGHRATSQTGLSNGHFGIMRWIYHLYFCVLLPSACRIHQSIALCTPEKKMIPAVQRLHQVVKTNSMLHEEAPDNKLGPSLCCDRPQAYPSSSTSSAAAFVSSPLLSAGIFGTSSDVMNSITLTQHSILKRIAECDRDGEPRLMEYSDMLLHVCEQMTSYTPWALWNSTTPFVQDVDALANSAQLNMDKKSFKGKQSRDARHPRSEDKTDACSSSSAVLCSIPSVNTNESSSECTRHPNLTNMHAEANTAQTHVPLGPPPPPIYEGYFVIFAANRLLRGLTQYNITSQEGAKLGHNKTGSSLLHNIHRVRALFFSLVGSLFRAADAAAYQRGLLKEQLRRGQLENSANLSTDTTRKKGDTAKRSFIPSFLGSFATPWSFTATDDDALREVQENLEAIDSYIEYHHHALCASITYLASALRSTQCTHWNSDSCATDPLREALSECCGAVLRLLSQQCLDALVPDAAVPGAFQLAPLPLSAAASPFEPAAAAAAEAGDSAFSLWWPFGNARSTTGGESAVGRVTRTQCAALIRVMAVIASLTRTQISPTVYLPLSPESVLSPQPVPLQKEEKGEEFAWSSEFVLHPATLSIKDWRKVAFSIRAMRLAETCGGATKASCWVCGICASKEYKNATNEKQGTLQELCFACGESLDCDVYIRSYLGVGLSHLNNTRHDILIRRVTTVEERNSLLAVFLLFRRALVRSSAPINPTQERSLHARQGRLPVTRRQMERRLLLLVSAFAFGVRQLLCAEELLR